MLLFMTAKGNIKTKWGGDFAISYFFDGREEAVVLYKGDITERNSLLVRIHSQCMISEVFGAETCDCTLQMANAQRDIQKEGRGMIIYLPGHQGRGNGLSAYIASLDIQANGISQDKAYEELGFQADRRSYDIAAKILKFFGIKSIRLMSSNKEKIKVFEKWGIGVSHVDYSNHFIDIARIGTLLDYKAIGQSVSPVTRENNKTYVLIIGDLCVDYLIKTAGNEVNAILNRPEPIVGGTGYNAAMAFAETGMKAVVFGKVGTDFAGRMIIDELERKKIIALIGMSQTKQTSFCTLFYSGKSRVLIKDDSITTNANDYDLENLKQTLKLDIITKHDCIFMAGHFLTRYGVEHSRKLMEIVLSAGARIVFDVVPHNLHSQISLEEFNSVIQDNVTILIAEYKTLMALLGRIQNCGENDKDEPTDSDIHDIMANFKAKIIDIRYGEANISKQIICTRDKNGETFQILEKGSTGFDGCSLEDRKGFGDKLTTKTVVKYLAAP